MPRKRTAHYRKPPLTIARILAWADDYKRRIGRWPNHRSGRIRSYDESWLAINAALGHGHRGLPGLTADQILTWADAYFGRHGEWPYHYSGPIDEVPTETWSGIDTALRNGLRGLRQESSLPAFLNKYRNLYRGKSRRPKRIPPA